jgi:hypothetical protein
MNWCREIHPKTKQPYIVSPQAKVPRDQPEVEALEHHIDILRNRLASEGQTQELCALLSDAYARLFQLTANQTDLSTANYFAGQAR